MRSTLTRSNVLKVNQFKIVQNWIMHYHWSNKDIKQSINDILDHYREMTGIEFDITIDDVKNNLEIYVNKCIDNINYLQNEINKDREKCISPNFKTIKEYLLHQEIKLENVKDYQDFLKNNVITEF